MNLLTIPDRLTLIRLILTIPIAILMVQGNFITDVLALLLYTVAVITDFLDGYLARKWQQISKFGSFFDPLADKVLVTSILILLVYQTKVDPWLVMLLLNRDLVVGGVRSVAASQGLTISAGSSGKLKTALQMLALPLIIISPLSSGIYYLGYGALWGSVVLSLVSAGEYIRLYRRNK